jgi:hypothetical protein
MFQPKKKQNKKTCRPTVETASLTNPSCVEENFDVPRRQVSSIALHWTRGVTDKTPRVQHKVQDVYTLFETNIVATSVFR